jgi:hypothetical protein
VFLRSCWPASIDAQASTGSCGAGVDEGDHPTDAGEEVTTGRPPRERRPFLWLSVSTLSLLVEDVGCGMAGARLPHEWSSYAVGGST